MLNKLNKHNILGFITHCDITRYEWPMITNVLVLLVCSTAVLSHSLFREAECLRLCRLARKQGSKANIKTSSGFPSCPECLDRSKEQLQVEGDLNVPGIRKHRKRRSLLDPQPSQDCPFPSESFGKWIPSEVKVSFGKYINTDFWYVNCSWTAINDSQGKWNAILIRLGVENASKRFDGGPPQGLDNICFILPKNQTFFRINISSYDYHYPDPIFLAVTSLPYSDVSNFMARYKPGLNGTSDPLTAYNVTSTSPSKKCCLGSSKTVANTVSISIGALTGLALVGGLLAYISRRRKKYHAPLRSDYKYHVFIIYSNKDKLWMKKLLTLLEEKHHLKCCVHYRNWPLGRPFRDNMAESVYNSYKVIALFSSNFVQSGYCNYELDLAIGREEKSRDNSLALIRIDGVSFQRLPSKLKHKTLIDYVDVSQKPLWKRKLIEFLDLPLDSETNGDHINNNNFNECQVNKIEGGTRTRFSRLDSTTSNDSQTPLVS